MAHENFILKHHKRTKKKDLQAKLIITYKKVRFLIKTKIIPIRLKAIAIA